MAFPAIPASTAGYQFSAETTNTTTHDVVVPTTINAGDLLLVFLTTDGAETIDLTGAGFSLLRTPVSGLATVSVWAKVATGSETNFTYTTTSQKSHNNCLRVTGWYGSLAGVEASTGATATSDAPNADTLSPSWGSADTLWLAYYGQNDPNTGGAQPASYTLINTSNLGGTGSVNDCLGSRENATATEDPGVFGTTSASDVWGAVTVAVRPAAAFTTFERTAAIAATGAVTVANREFWSVFSRTAALAATGAVTVAGFNRDHLRSAALAGTGAIATTGTFWTEFSRSAALGATGAITISNHEVLRIIERAASLAATGAITVANREFWSTFERSAALAATGAITISNFLREVERAVALAASGSIAVSGQFWTTFERAVAIIATGTISTSGTIWADPDPPSLGATIYTQLGYPGPWLCEDANITCEGYLYNGEHVSESSLGGPTCEGVATPTNGASSAYKDRPRHPHSRHKRR